MVVAALEERGLFLIKDEVGTIAERLGVTRSTIYIYLNEVQFEAGHPEEALM